MSAPQTPTPPCVAASAGMGTASNSNSSGVSGSGSGSYKNEIKVSAEGVAKLTFSFLDEQGDSSLEPGEVKTPPHGSSPELGTQLLPTIEPRGVVKTDVAEPSRKESKSRKLLKTASQLEAEMCEEKVRAILELDAIRRREEVEKRKQQMENRQRSGELDEGEEIKKKAKEERKRLKRLKREQKAARLALLSGDEEGKEEGEDEEEEGIIKSTKKKKQKLKDFDSYSSTHSTPERSDELRSVASAIAVTGALTTRYPLPLAGPSSMIPMFSDPYGIRPMVPFMRGMRPDFHHARGGFIPRGRGSGMRGNMRFPGYRPPFYAGGAMLPRHHGPMQQQPHTPPPARGHSPVQPPHSDLLWTKTKPSISYAFNVHPHDSQKSKCEQKITEASDSNTFIRSKSKSHKKSKKQEEREKIKKRRSSRNSSEKSSKRKIERIRKSLQKRPDCKYLSDSTPEHKSGVKEHKLQRALAEKKEMEMKSVEEITEVLDVGKKVEGDCSIASEIKTETSKTPIMNEIPSSLEFIKDTIKFELGDERISTKENKNYSTTTTAGAESISEKVFDMFADSPPRTLQKPAPMDIDNLLQAARKASTNTESNLVHKGDKNKESPSVKLKNTGAFQSIALPANDKKSPVNNEEVNTFSKNRLTSCSTTPPRTPPLSITTNKLQEIQKRIGKLLEEDDLPMATIQATKEMLLRKNLAKDTDVVRAKKHEEANQPTIPSSVNEINRSPMTAKNRHRSQTRDKQRSPTKDRRTPVREKTRSPLKEKARTPTREKQRSPTPEDLKHKNPFKRSISRDRYFGKIDCVQRSQSRSRTREQDRERERDRGRKSERRSEGKSKPKSSEERYRNRSVQRHPRKSRNRSSSGEHSKRGSTSSLSRPNSKDRDKNDSRHEQIKRKLSKSPHKKQPTSTQDKLVERKVIKSTTPAREITRPDVAKRNLTSKRKRTQQPLSFTAAEFLFPEDTDADVMDDDAQISPRTPEKVPAIRSEAIPCSKHTKKTMERAEKSRTEDDSPDTDDYLDNWENLDVDIDANSNAACESSTPSRPSQSEVDVARFVNPSPPMELLKLKQSTPRATAKSTTPTTPPPVVQQNIIPASDKAKDTPSKPHELFGMQELYDQFMKSVEESGVDMKTVPPKVLTDSTVENSLLDQADDHVSTTSTSSSSSSSSSTSSSDVSSSSSSSSTSSSASSSEDSNDTDTFQKSVKESPKSTPPLHEVKEVSNIAAPVTLPIKPTVEDHTENTSSIIGGTPPISPAPIVEIKPEPSPLLPPPQVIPAITIKQAQAQAESTNAKPAAAAAPAKAQKSDVAKDFKKLKSLEANLARIQMMRANYDSADEISEELLKMEKLFLQEKNLILQKYAKTSSKSSTSTAPPQPQPQPADNNTQATELSPKVSTSNEQNMTGASTATPLAPPTPAGQFVQSLQETPTEEPLPAVSKIFDTNREAIKLTISPLKLPKTPAIFESAVAEIEENDAETGKSATDAEEMDFTEKLVKPAKEIAIVKPIMECKDARTSHQRHRRTSPPSSQSSRASHDRPRSPGSYRDRPRRSSSRTRLSPQRRGRGRSLSMSPSRRSGARYVSPQRRGGFSSQARSYRSAGRRSRSRSRSITRQSSRRGGELTPPQRRRRQATTAQAYRKQRSMRDSRSRSPRSPGPVARHRSPRPHSPRSPPPPTRRRSYSRDRYSRSPLPFKPPSPPMRRSLSPTDTRRPNSLSPQRSISRRSRSLSRSHSPHMPRSPRSPRSPPSSRYDEHRHRRESSFDRRSISPQRQYYSQDSSNMSSSSSSYYYNVSPNRISLDARINIVLNGPSSNQESPGHGTLSSYEGYSNYSQYGGAAYMSVPPEAGNYYGNQYVQMSSGGPTTSSHAHQQAYSNIPTIGGASNAGISPSPHHGHTQPPNFYYNEFTGHPGSTHQPSSLLKELPKATVAVQKGNVLEIVPSNEVLPVSKAGETEMKPPRTRNAAISWKEEINNRQVTAAVMRLSREKNGSSRSILKNSESSTEVNIQEEKLSRKKVYFEDGIFPNRDSDDEDRKMVETRVRNKLRRLRKKRGISIPDDCVVTEKARKTEIQIDPALEKLPPPPPPLGPVPTHVEQPIYLRPITPTPVLYFHFDAVVHSMYVSQLERPIPPRLLNPKCLPPGSVVGVPPSNAAAQSPSHIQSPIGAISHHNTKKDLGTLAAINRSSRNERTSPAILSATAQRRDSPITPHLKTVSSIEIMHHAEQTPPPAAIANSPGIGKGNFQAIGAHSPQLSAQPAQRQASPIGFAGMRINNFMRLPPSPLARGVHPPLVSHAQAPIPVIGVRHAYNIPPPSMLPSTPAPPIPSQSSNEYSAQHQQQQQHQHQYMHQHNAYPISASAMVPMTHLPPTASVQRTSPSSSQPQPQQQFNVPLAHNQQRQPPPNYFMQQVHVPSLPPPPLRHLVNPMEVTNPNTVTVKCESPQAMVAPFNVKKS